MTARACFTAKLASGRVDREAGGMILDELDRLEQAYAAQAGKAGSAGQAAAADALSAAAHMAWREEQKALNALRAQLTAARAVADYDGRVGLLRDEGKAPVTLSGVARRFFGGVSTLESALRAVLTRDPHEIATTGNVHYAARQIRAEAQRRMRATIETLRPKLLGLKEETAAQIDVLRALFGDPAASAEGRAAAEGWSAAAAYLRERFVAAGGWIPERANWRLGNPVADPLKVRSISADDFVARVRPLLDRDQMISFRTGLKLDDAELDALLRQVRETIASGGVEGGPTAAVTGRGALSERRDAMRVLVFKDADGWMQYHADFGRGSIWDAMGDHVEAMARETAQLEVLGDPQTFKRYALSLFDREAQRLARTAPAGDAKAAQAALKDNQAIAGEVAAGRSRFLALFAEVTGARETQAGNLAVAGWLGAQRSLLTAAQMGSALLASLTDPGTLLMAARFNGISGMGAIRRAVAGMADHEFELNALQIGVAADSFARGAHAVDRFLGEEIGAGRAAKLSNAVVRASGLRKWTELLRRGFAEEFQAALANRRGQSFAEADAAFRGALTRYGVTPAEWAALKDAPLHTPVAGADFVSPPLLREAGLTSLADKLGRMVDTEMDHAVIDADPISRSLILGGSAPGTVGGETRRAVGMYKQFPLTFVMTHFARATARGWDGSRLSHGALTFMTMWGLGVVSMQAKEIANGRDPLTLDPTEPAGLRAFGKAMLQGGGLGVFGDFVALDQTRYGNTWAAMLAGPQAGQIEAALGDFLSANIGRAIKGEPTHFAGDALYVGARYLPGQSLWFSRLAFQRAVVDAAAQAIDDRAPERFRRMERAAVKAFDQSHWWAPGEARPDRSPDLAAIGGRP